MAEPAPFPEDYKAGHFVLIGPTGTGKTYYAKYILKGLMAARPGLRVFIFVSPVSAHDWLEPEADGRPLAPPDAVHTSWAAEEVAAIYDALKASIAVGGLVIFDDFKGQLDYHNNKEFKEFFRVFRHLNTQVLAIGHTPNDVPPVVRENVSHCILTVNGGLEVVRALASSYLGGDVARLREALAALRGHDVLRINVRRNTIDVHSASGVSTSEIGCAGAGSGSAGSGSSGGGEGGPLLVPIGGPAVAGASVSLRGRGDVAVRGVYNDASTTNQYLRLEENLVAQQRASVVAVQDMQARARASRALELEGEAHSARLRELGEAREAFDLLHRVFLSPGDRDRLGAILARRLGDAGVTGFNFRARGADREFMRVFFPEHLYEPPPAALQEGALFVPRLVAGEFRGLAGDLALGALGALGAPPGSGLLGAAGRALAGLGRGLAGRAGLPADAAASGARPAGLEKGGALRLEIRRLALALAGPGLDDAERGRLSRLLAEEGGAVAPGKLTRRALGFLHEAFPEDLEAILARRAREAAEARERAARAARAAREARASEGGQPLLEDG